ncbi:hypothetical protein NL676_017209 [Syzygium grande]|nr:hypothetical protein NL676_017209 [Syzygium grande]
MNVTVLNISLPVPDNSRGPHGFFKVSQPVFYSQPNLPNCTGRAVNSNIVELDGEFLHVLADKDHVRVRRVQQPGVRQLLAAGRRVPVSL